MEVAVACLGLFTCAVLMLTVCNKDGGWPQVPLGSRQWCLRVAIVLSIVPGGIFWVMRLGWLLGSGKPVFPL